MPQIRNSDSIFVKFNLVRVKNRIENGKRCKNAKDSWNSNRNWCKEILLRADIFIISATLISIHIGIFKTGYGSHNWHNMNCCVNMTNYYETEVFWVSAFYYTPVFRTSKFQQDNLCFVITINKVLIHEIIHVSNKLICSKNIHIHSIWLDKLKSERLSEICLNKHYLWKFRSKL